MRLSGILPRSILCRAILSAAVALAACPAWGGALRINLQDGSSIEVPYFWEEGGEVKFEFTGGVVGIPRSEVASVQEILAAREFDPEALVSAPQESPPGDRSAGLREYVADRLPPKAVYEKLDRNRGLELLQMENLTSQAAKTSRERIRGPLFRVESESAELVRVRGGGVMLLMENVLSSRSDLRELSFTLAAYDAEGRVLQRKPCEVQEVVLDRKSQKALEHPGRLFAVSAALRPDPQIRSYEITAARR